ncbi:MAG: AAA family ATPase, partial [Lentisphaeria bacterium]|nr:AAA family ATPase [Lentisphaeria bacterium]
MKKYVEKVDKWRVLKALSYLGNFFKNHKGSVNDNDLFIPVSDYMEGCDWESEIRKTFSQSAIKRMSESNRRRYCLDFEDRPVEMLYCIWNAPFARKKLADWLCAKIREILQESPLEKFCNETFPVRLAELQKTFALTDFDIEVLCVLAFVRNDMLTIVDGHNRQTDENDKAVFVAKCLDCDVSDVQAALDCKGKLRRYGCIDNEFDFNGRLFAFLNGISCEPLSSRYFKVCQEECLPWDFYGNLAEKHGELIKSILRDSRSAGNILLYGAPGTGKTSFAKTIAGQLGRKCYIISQDTKMSDQSTSSPEHRFAALQICDIQVDPAESLIIVDEADDM